MRKLLFFGLLFSLSSNLGCQNQHAFTTDKGFFEVWPAPKDKPYIKPESGADYPAYFPTFAVLYSDNNYMGFVLDNNATLFFLVGTDLNENNVVKHIPTHTRFAIPVYLPIYGRWASFDESSKSSFFVIVYESGGTAGPIIEVFLQDVSYLGPQFEGQHHSFDSVFYGHTELPPYTSDLDENSVLELLIQVEDNKDVYAVYKWDEERHSFVEIDRLKGELVRTSKKFRKIELKGFGGQLFGE